MSGSELSALSRAHQLFAGTPRDVALDADLAHYDRLLQRAAGLNTGGGQELYQSAVDHSRAGLRSAASTDAALAATAAQAHRDHANARALTKSVLDEARADAAIPSTPMAQREAVRRRVARLRAQQAHVLSARQQ
ncbi:MAG: NlpC/P60 family protein, partial [Mycobacterium sp.]